MSLMWVADPYDADVDTTDPNDEERDHSNNFRSSGIKIIEIGDRLKQRIREVLVANPLGLTMDKFMIKFRRTYRYYPNFINYGYMSLSQMVTMNPHLFAFDLSSIGEILLFAASTDKAEEQTPTPVAFFLKMYQIMGENSPINNLSPICIIGKMSQDKGIISHAYFFNDNGHHKFNLLKGTVKYLSPDFEDLHRIISEAKQNSKAETSDSNQSVKYYYLRNESEIFPKIIESFDEHLYKHGFANTKDKMEWISSDVGFWTKTKHTSYFRCYAAYIRGPDEFYIILGGNMLALDDIRYELNIKYNVLEQTPEFTASIPWREHLTPGCIIAVKKQDGDWTRGQIIKEITRDKFKVMLIDYGDVIKTHISRIRYLTLQLFKDLKAQGIKCSVELSENFKSLQWKKSENKLFRNMLYHQNLAVKFLYMENSSASVTGEPNASPIWKVIVHLLKPGREFIRLHHVDREVIRISRNGYLEEEKFTETRTRIKCSYEQIN